MVQMHRSRDCYWTCQKPQRPNNTCRALKLPHIGIVVARAHTVTMLRPRRSGRSHVELFTSVGSMASGQHPTFSS